MASEKYVPLIEPVTPCLPDVLPSDHEILQALAEVLPEEVARDNIDIPPTVPDSTDSMPSPDSSTPDEKHPKPRVAKRTRTQYSSFQLLELEREFENSRYLSKTRKINLAQILNVSEKQIKVWFQNRRMKFKAKLTNNPGQDRISQEDGRSENSSPGTIKAEQPTITNRHEAHSVLDQINQYVNLGGPSASAIHATTTQRRNEFYPTSQTVQTSTFILYPDIMVLARQYNVPAGYTNSHLSYATEHGPLQSGVQNIRHLQFML